MLSVCPVVEVDIGSSFNPAPCDLTVGWGMLHRYRKGTGMTGNVVMGEWSLLFPLVRLISLPIIATISLLFGVTVVKEKALVLLKDKSQK